MATILLMSLHPFEEIASTSLDDPVMQHFKRRLLQKGSLQSIQIDMENMDN